MAQQVSDKIRFLEPFNGGKPVKVQLSDSRTPTYVRLYSISNSDNGTEIRFRYYNPRTQGVSGATHICQIPEYEPVINQEYEYE